MSHAPSARIGVISAVINGWNKFWFAPTDPTTLGLIRVLAGSAIFMIHFAYCFDLQELLGPDAWVNAPLATDTRQHVPVTLPPSGWEYPQPAEAIDNNQRSFNSDYVNRWGIHPSIISGEGNYSWSVWYHLQDPVAMRWMHGAILTIMFLFAIGFATRLTSVLSLIGALQYVHRAQANLFGMDQMVIVLLLYLSIGNSGAMLSLDRWLARRGWSWTRIFGGQAEPVADHDGPSVSANLASAPLFHLCRRWSRQTAGQLVVERHGLVVGSQQLRVYLVPLLRLCERIAMAVQPSMAMGTDHDVQRRLYDWVPNFVPVSRLATALALAHGHRRSSLAYHDFHIDGAVGIWLVHDRVGPVVCPRSSDSIGSFPNKTPTTRAGTDSTGPRRNVYPAVTRFLGSHRPHTAWLGPGVTGIQ
jgi:hypothetical protein